MIGKKVYSFKDGYPHGRADPQAVGEWLDGIERKHGRKTAAIVVEESRPPSAPAHDLIWKLADEEAAYQHRMQLARGLIGAVVYDLVVPDGYVQNIRVRQSVNLPDALVGEEGGGHETYWSTERAMAKAPVRDAVVAMALREMDAFQQRYVHLSELAEIFEAAERVKQRQRRKQRSDAEEQQTV